MNGILSVYSFVIRSIIPICSLGTDQVVFVSISTHSNRENCMYHYVAYLRSEPFPSFLDTTACHKVFQLPLESLWFSIRSVVSSFTKCIHFIYYQNIIRLSSSISVRQYRRGNTKWTIQRTGNIRCSIRRRTEQKHNTLRIRHHSTQRTQIT